MEKNNRKIVKEENVVKGIDPKYLIPDNEPMKSVLEKSEECEELLKEYRSLMKERVELDAKLQNKKLEESKKNVSHVSNAIALGLNVVGGVLAIMAAVAALKNTTSKN